MTHILICIIMMLVSPLVAETLGIIGGRSSGNDNYAAFVASDSTAVASTSSLPATSSALKVTINTHKQALIGGRTTAPSMYAAFVSPDSLTPLVISNVPTGNNSFLNSVVINDSGQGLIGGSNLNTPYAAWVNFESPAATAISSSSLPAGVGTIDSVSLNASGNGLIGGSVNNLQDAYAARVSFGQTSVSPISGIPTGGSSVIYSVALNNSDQGLIGGVNHNSAYAAFIAPQSTTPIPISGLPSTVSAIGNAAFEGQGVALNNSGEGLIVGHNNANAYAAWVSIESPTPTVITSLPAGGNSLILTAALNDSGIGLIGGLDRSSGTSAGYAAWVSSGGTTPVPITNLPSGGTSEIFAVAVNQFGQGLIGGVNNGNAYAALLAPGSILPVTLIGIPIGGGTTLIDSVAFALSSLAIPTESLCENNLNLANYINQNAPQDCFYFIPSIFDGTTNCALKSAAPTRNSISIFTVDNNLFSLNTAFSLHSQISRQFKSSYICKKYEERPYEIWGELIGAFAHQEAQNQTPGFNPESGGFILGFNTQLTVHGKLGVGTAYMFTHVHEHEGAGHSNINQEYLFLCGSWDNSMFYFDGAVWGGFFQIKNFRNITMAGFDFETTSSPQGWQMAPHVEFGYDHAFHKITLEPFFMLDWINNWAGCYKERGDSPFNFKIDSQYSSFLRNELGLRLYETIDYASWRLGFKEKVSYVNRKPFGVGHVTASLVGSPGFFTLNTFTAPQNLGAAEFGIIFEPIDPKYPCCTIDYQGEFGSKFQFHQIFLNLNWHF